MAYVRQHGNQLAIVHGERHPKTRKVEQRILFALYSREEAEEALGRGQGSPPLRSLLEARYPKVSFDWKRIEDGIKSNLHVLPESYPYRETRLRDAFRDDLRSFARRLLLTDPQMLCSSAELLQEHRHELGYLIEMISWRLKVLPEADTGSPWRRDNRFFWRFELQAGGVPPSEEEFIDGLLERGKTEKAEAGLRLLTECFEDYADGFNSLGAIALERGDLEGALGHYRRAVELGRRLFPGRIARSRYWNDHTTRPYMRGLRNLAAVLNRAGRYDEALEVCDRMEKGCGDDIAACVQRAAIHLNTGRWREAKESAVRLHNLFPEESFLAALAFHELRDPAEALVHFLHGALNRPRAARMLIGRPDDKPGSSDEARDHNTGVDLRLRLGGYLKKRFPRSRKFFEGILALDRVDALLDEAKHVVRRWSRQVKAGHREAFDRMHEMHTPEYARARAREILPILVKLGIVPER